jgi:cytochrome P450
MLGGQGQTVDACDLFFRYTLDAATDFLLGKSVDSLVEEQTRFASAFNDVQHTQSLIAKSGPMQWFIPRRKFRQQIKIMDDFTNQYIEQALSLSQDELEKRTKNEEGYTFLHALASFTKDRTVLRDQLVAVLLAGRDTTACSLSWLFYELSTHPDCVAKLRQEILNTVGEDKMPSYTDMKSMKYLQVSLRIYQESENHQLTEDSIVSTKPFACTLLFHSTSDSLCMIQPCHTELVQTATLQWAY